MQQGQLQRRSRSRADLALAADFGCLAVTEIRLTLAIMNYGNNTHSAVIND